MFKNMLKRAALSTIRKLSRSAILILILFVMANMLLACFTIKNSVNVSMQAAKEKLGAIVYLQFDMQVLVAEEIDGETIRRNVEIPTISEDLVQKIAQSEYVKDYTYSVVAGANASGFTPADTAQNEREKQFQAALDDAQGQVDDFNASRDQFNANNRRRVFTGPGGVGGGGPGGGQASPNFNFSFSINDPTLTRGDISIQGINDFTFVEGIEDGQMKLIEGASFNEDSENAVIISSELAEKNSLNVGDKIKLKTTADSPVELEFTIIGIYKNTTEDYNYNNIFTNITGAKKFYTAEQLESLGVQNVKYYLTSASSKDAFLSAAIAANPELETNNLKLDINDEAYQTMVGPIENVGSFATIVLWIVIIAAVVIITLIVVINIKDRRYEMGVLMSLGAKRTNILGQILVELVIVGTVGFLGSLATSQLLAREMGETLLKQEVAASQEEEEDPTGANMARINRIGRMASMGSGTTAEPIKEIDVSSGLTDYLLLFSVGYGIILLAMLIPSINILRYQPRQILAGKE